MVRKNRYTPISRRNTTMRIVLPSIVFRTLIREGGISPLQDDILPMPDGRFCVRLPRKFITEVASTFGDGLHLRRAFTSYAVHLFKQRISRM